MATNYDDLDIEFGWSGDLLLEAGDIKDTSDDGLRSLVDQLHSICASEFEDWLIYPNRAADISSFIGEPNSPETIAKLHDRLRIAIVSAGLVTESDLKINPIPVSPFKLLIIFKVNAAATAFNQIDELNGLQVAFVFNSLEQTVFYVSQRNPGRV